jgi:hypothetical protein
MSDPTPLSNIENDTGFARTILSYVSHKYLIIGGFLLSAAPLLFPNLDQDIQLSVQKCLFLFLGISFITLFFAIINIFFKHL